MKSEPNLLNKARACEERSKNLSSLSPLSSLSLNGFYTDFSEKRISLNGFYTDFS